MFDIKSALALISIHALRGEGDYIMPLIQIKYGISIHALRGEGDIFRCQCLSGGRYFNPRPPWGGRLTWFFFI